MPNSPATASRTAVGEVKGRDVTEIHAQLCALQLQQANHNHELEFYKHQHAEAIAKMKVEVATLKLQRITFNTDYSSFSEDNERRLNFSFLRSCLLAEHNTNEDRLRAIRILGGLEYPDNFGSNRLVYRGPHKYGDGQLAEERCTGW